MLVPQVRPPAESPQDPVGLMHEMPGATGSTGREPERLGEPGGRGVNGGLRGGDAAQAGGLHHGAGVVVHQGAADRRPVAVGQ